MSNPGVKATLAVKRACFKLVSNAHQALCNSDATVRQIATYTKLMNNCCGNHVLNHKFFRLLEFCQRVYPSLTYKER